MPNNKSNKNARRAPEGDRPRDPADNRGRGAPDGGKGHGPQVKPPVRKERPIDVFAPYIFGAVGLFLLACFVMDIISMAKGWDSTADHLFGAFGYWLCRGLYGLFGWAAFFLPVFLLIFAFLWGRSRENGTRARKIVISVTFLLSLSCFIQVCWLSADGSVSSAAFSEYHWKLFDTSHDFSMGTGLFETGARFESGGIVGGLLGNLMYFLLKFVGNLCLFILGVPVLVIIFFDISPRRLYRAVRNRFEKAAAKRKQRRAEREEKRRLAAPAGADADEDDRPDGEPDDESDTDEDGDDGDGEDDDGDDGDAVLTVPTPVGRTEKTPERKATDPDGPGEGRIRRTRTVPPAPAAVETADTDATDEVGEKPADATEEQVLPPVPEDPDEDGLYVPDGDLPGDGGLAAETNPLIVGRMEVTVGDGDDDLYEDEEEDETDPVADGDTADGEDGEDDDLPGQPVGEAGDGDTPAVGLVKEAVIVPHKKSAKPTRKPANEYVFPPIEYLTKGPDHYEADEEEIARNKTILKNTLESFKIRVLDISCSCGPTITRFEVKPDVGIRVRSIAGLVDDIAMNLAKSGVRIEAPIPGKSAVGIEVPNANPASVYLRNLIETAEFQNHKSKIAACLGADVSGRPVIFDINKMPHMLIAGATGMGKSVCINSIVISILYRAKPSEVKFIMIDPKKVEFTMYRELPHLYCPIVSDPKKAAGALYSACNEMERRYELIEEVGARNIAGYNEAVKNDPDRPKMPQIVIVIDELADLMMTAPGEVETAVCRLAQKARAAGIHLIIGTQRPSVDVITGLIKANIPSRIACTVASQVDSRTIIDMNGAEKLIGRGDMLFAPVGSIKPIRVQGAFVSDSEVENVITFIKEHNDRVVFDQEFVNQIDIEAAKCGNGKKKGEGGQSDDFSTFAPEGDAEDPVFWKCVEIAVSSQKVSTSLLQRHAQIGYGRAAKIIDRMEELGYVSPGDGNKPRKLYITAQDLSEMRVNGRMPNLPTSPVEADGADDPDDFDEA